MPGAYAHITLVNLLKEPARLEAVKGFPASAISAVLSNFKFCELGAVSPDYPYLAILDSKAAPWADLMHKENTGEMIRVGAELLRERTGADQRRGLAWLLGYAAHVVADVTIHPVVMRRVGPYEANKTAHRVCEMNQDAHIFRRLKLGGIGLSEHLDSGISRCGDSSGLHPAVRDLWLEMLQRVYPEAFSSNPPDPSKWHEWFTKTVDLIEEGNKLIPLARHVSAGKGLTYPNPDEVDTSYTINLDTPGRLADYDVIFDRAVANAAEVWRDVAASILDNTPITSVRNWNLDTGEDEEGDITLWRTA